MEIIQRRLLSKKKSPSLLPKEYQQVEWIESSGGAYIDTNQKFTHPISFKIRVQKTVPEAVNVFGATGNASSTNTGYGGRVIFNSNNASNEMYNAIAYYNQYQAYLPLNFGKWCEIELGNGYAVFDGAQKTFTTGRYSSTFNIALFGINNSGTVSPSPVRISMFQIHTGDVEPVVARDFIPCYRKSDGMVGMYDLSGSVCPLTGTPLYINAGAGEFIKGDDVNAL